MLKLPNAPLSCKVSTPPSLARAMAIALDTSQECDWLDPCIGEGALVIALANLGIPRHCITAFDIDPTPQTWDVFAKTTRSHDFIDWSLSTSCRFNKIIANPPYVAISKLSDQLKQTAANVKDIWDNRIGLGPNYWYAFLNASLKVLKDGGDLCFVLPAAWDYADYAKPLRNDLNKLFKSFIVHRSSEPLFSEVQEGCVIVLGKGYRQNPKIAIRLEHKTSRELIEALIKKDYSECNPLKDYTESIISKNDEVKLGDIIDVRLGGVTGDANYFLMNEDQRASYGLPAEAVVPALTKASHLQTAFISQKAWLSLRDAGKRVWLFRPSYETLRNSQVLKYLNMSEELGGCQRNRYKIRIRDPWYITPLPDQIDGFMSGMTQKGPWIAFKQMRHLTASNTLYTIRFKNKLNKQQKAAWAISLLSSSVYNQVSDLKRTYPDGLNKLEPGDLKRLILRRPVNTTNAVETYKKVINLLLSHQTKSSRLMADEWLSGE